MRLEDHDGEICMRLEGRFTLMRRIATKSVQTTKRKGSTALVQLIRLTSLKQQQWSVDVWIIVLRFKLCTNSH